MANIFNPSDQHNDPTTKIVVGLERISEAFRTLLWDHAKERGLSPIQIQILIFVAHHEERLCNVSHLAQEFNLTKPTISDAVRVLANKKQIVKTPSAEDKRAYSIALSESGKAIVNNTENFAAPIQAAVDELPEAIRDAFFQNLSKVIYSLNKAGIIKVQRTCYACRYYRKAGANHYCQLLEQPLFDRDIRLDCPEFEAR